MPDVTLAAPQTNGAAPSLPHAEELIERLRQLIDERAARRDELAGELATIDREIKAYSKSLAPLLPDALAPAPSKRPAASKTSQTHRSRVSPERLAVVEAAVRRLAEGDAEFRQIDVTKETGITSSVMGSAFEQLREANVIRLARQQRGPGGGKFFRLTKPALREDAQ
jgi:DNA-binding transcriptional ArsR family regulator